MRPRKVEIKNTGDRMFLVTTEFYPEEMVNTETLDSTVNQLAQFSLDTLKKQNYIIDDAELMVVFASQVPGSSKVTITVVWHSDSIDGELPSEQESLSNGMQEIGQIGIDELIRRFGTPIPQATSDPADQYKEESVVPGEYTVYVVCDNLDLAIFTAKQMKPVSHLLKKHIPTIWKDPTYSDYVINITFPEDKMKTAKIEGTLMHLCDYNGIDVYDAEEFTREYFEEHGKVICKDFFTLAEI